MCFWLGFGASWGCTRVHFVVGFGRLLGVAISGCFCCHSASPLTVVFAFLLTPILHIHGGGGGEWAEGKGMVGDCFGLWVVGVVLARLSPGGGGGVGGGGPK